MLGLIRRRDEGRNATSSHEHSLRRAPVPTKQRAAHGLVLMIDDDDYVRRAARHILELFGFEVVEASGGREGLETFRAHIDDVKIVLLDMTMPDMSGQETFRALRRIDGNVPVILTSGCSEMEATREFSPDGLAGFLHKPFMPEEMANMISSAIGECC